MLETAIIGKLGNINPFNQPAVEEVKINTKRNLIKFFKDNLDRPYFLTIRMFKRFLKSS